MIANRLKTVLLGLTLLAGLCHVAQAEGRWRAVHSSDVADAHAPPYRGDSIVSRGGHRPHDRFVENRRIDRQGDGRRNRPAEIDRMTSDGVTSVTRTRQIDGFYGGRLAAYADRGNGVYFLHDNNNWSYHEETSDRPVPRAKIIDVADAMRSNALAGRNACSMEHGVCVIRGDR